jgi:hypothetical protein
MPHLEEIAKAVQVWLQGRIAEDTYRGIIIETVQRIVQE